MTDKQQQFVIIDDNQERAQELAHILKFIGVEARAHSSSELLNDPELKNDVFAVVLGETGAKDMVLDQLTQEKGHVPVLLVDDEMDKPNELAKKLQQSSVIGQFEQPFRYNQIVSEIHNCQQHWKVNQDSAANEQDEQAKPFDGLVGTSAAIQRVTHLMQQVAKSDVNVLILGESGTGKEVVARHLHELSARKDKNFVPVNCGAIPKDLLESELFGHEKGAFTGAITARQGRFEMAQGGTLFLDEIGDMPLTMQVKLLRVLQERCFERVGSNKSIQTDARIIAATHRNLEEEIKAGTFREDLYYRLNVFPIEVPTLRDRIEDLPLLINEIVARLEPMQETSIHILPRAIQTLSQYSWPGNVRELANLIERLMILHPNGVVDSADLPAKFRGEGAPEQISVNNDSTTATQSSETLSDTAELMLSKPGGGIDLKEHLAKTELALIKQALDEADGVVARAASFLNMRRTTLVEKMRKYGISRSDVVNPQD